MTHWSSLSRRRMLGGMAALAAPAAAAGPRYKLGVMASMYGALSLGDAMRRIRKIGYRYICLARKHGDESILAPEVPSAERGRILRRMREQGVEPFLSLGGFGAEPTTEDGLRKYIEQLDLCAAYEVPIMVGGGPWYYKKFPTLPKRELDWRQEVDRFYAGLEKALRHAERVRVVICLKPHTGITARGRDCLQVLKRIDSPWLKIAWDAGNISYYEGIYPDPDLPDLAPQVKAVCLKDHLGLRGEANFPVPGQGNVDHEAMFRTLFAAGFQGPLAIERVDGKDGGMNKVPIEEIDRRLTAAHQYLAPLLDRITSGQ